MNVSELQTWLNAHGASIVVDGQAGPATRAAIIAAFTNKEAPAVTAVDIEGFAAELGCSVKQINAVATVESAGGGFDKQGRPKILFERHKFWRATDGKFGHTIYSAPTAGGYGVDSWEKLTRAAGKDPDAAFASASWGKFQVMGFHWRALGYASPLEMAYQMSRSEKDHYEALVGFIEANGLERAVRALSTNAADCVAFARGYNGSGYARNRYDQKLAAAMR
jgi:N-acetylmuramidase